MMNFSSEGHALGIALSSKTKTDVYADSCLVLDEKRYFVAVKGVSLKLSKTEFLIVSCLVSRMNGITRLEDLWRHAWDEKKAMNRKSIQVMMSRVRGKLAPRGLRIDSVVDVGYMLSHGSCCEDQATQSARD